MAPPLSDVAFLHGLGDELASAAVSGLHALRNRLSTLDDPLLRQALARAIPKKVAELSPEVSVALHALAEVLYVHRPAMPEDLETLDPWLRVQWIRLGVATNDHNVDALLDEPTLRQVVHGWSLKRVLDPRPVIDRLCGAADPWLRSEGLGHIRPSVVGLALSPAEALQVLIPLAGDQDPTIRAPAISMLHEGWLRDPPPAAARARDSAIEAAFIDDNHRVAGAAIQAAISLSRRDWLWARLLDSTTPLFAREEILRTSGALAENEGLDAIIAVALEDPLALGVAAHHFLRDAHRHGIFVRGRHIESVMALFDTYRGWSGEELGRVTHIVRDELVEHLAVLTPDDRRWCRRAEILAVSMASAAPRLIASALRATSDPTIAQALVYAAGRSPGYRDESALLGWLDALPEAVVPVLRIKGGPESEKRLRVVVEDPLTASSLRQLAIASLWALARDRGPVLRHLCTQLGPHESGLLRGTYLEPRDRAVARLVVDAPWASTDAHVIAAEQQLSVLCESGDAEFLPQVEGLFRELVRRCVGKALAGDFAIKRLTIPELEQKVFLYGRHQIAAGRSVRRFIEEEPETGRDLVLRFVCDWLSEEPSAAVMVALLETVARHQPSGAILRAILPLWRHRQAQVQRAAVEAILTAGEGARGLELSLCRLIRDDDARIVVQALAAVRILNARWAEPMVLHALRHPHMAVKREAAAALAVIASAKAVPTIVEWLARHDNQGLRDSLGTALAGAAGASMVAVLVDALTLQTEPRPIQLLQHALGGRLRLAAALRLARSEHAAHQELVDACIDARVRLADASRHELLAQLHRQRLLPTEHDPDDPCQRLRIEGFSPLAAEAVLSFRSLEHDPQLLAAVQPAIAEWIAWLKADSRASPAALTLVLDAASSLGEEHIESLLDLVRAAPAPDVAAAAGFIERCIANGAVSIGLRIRATEQLRHIIAPSAQLGGLHRYELLGRLGAVRTHADLWQCLEQCRRRPAVSTESFALLRQALQIPAAEDDEDDERRTLREQAKRFHAWPQAERRTWLSSTLAQRPLGLPVLEQTKLRPKTGFFPSSSHDRESLLGALGASDPQDRARAATRLLDWRDADTTWPRVLEVFLASDLALEPRHLPRLAGVLTSWPTDACQSERARALLPHCSPALYRRFVQAWLSAWDEGNAAFESLLRDTPEAFLLPPVLRHAEDGDPRRLRLLRPSESLAMRTLLERLRPCFPEDVDALSSTPKHKEEHASPLDEDPEDPLAGLGVDALAATIGRKGVAKGLAVRAVHALARHGERAIAPLDSLVTDPRPPIRSAALRALRTVSSRTQSLAATARALGMETRRDVLIQLMKSLAHGRHEPSLPALLGRLEHRELQIRTAAEEAILAWGPEVVPALRRAGRRTRPDRRKVLEALVHRLDRDAN